ncbi:Glucose/arabinose dehydrogenase, beta-propeller fold [Pseudomonas koreensis]|uniref:Sorbosone dehydrogenase n=1 Tax=Pseudomonas koreensis TaxID=198620 RepID=A0AAC9BRQ7_9PSED|nr:sorbosone dehydrogenase family protein [Pseudomonas koreensis]ANH97367.1 sorbosone dehydrogenase [Pseudomonas koreensis]KAB0510618.1 sorbosone dehydrogenase family protein [Pseudomonas koreensis]NNA59554.1 sorbosone dehydrogenase family protein [Pseudomonas koreensis]SDC84543.1 Glucose/arabinose dehydrogenase, beta-propeller fold [Pseudomonas koreensis]GGK43917.1 sorbosone dehydrogenase [Pseudomonas koreensis]
MRKTQLALVIALAGGLAACGESSSLQVSDGTGPSPKLPEPNKTLIPTVNIAPAVGWPAGGKPTAAAGTQVAAFAEGLDHPRWLYVLPNGDVLVAETNAPPKPDDSSGIRGWVMKKVMGKAGAGVPSPNRITLLRDADHDGVAETRTVFLQNLNSPFGMTLVGNDLYVADTDRLLRFHYEPGATEIKSQPIKVTDLPGGTLNHHWTKNVIASKDGSKLYVTVGSNSNVGENGLDKEEGRAAIWEVDRATGNHRIFASGIRNPNGLAWEPTTGALWTAVNERDEIGSDLVPDYITSVKDGGFYGWPFSYYGQHVDVRVKPQNLDLVAKAIAPDYAVGPHTASLGLTFAEGNSLPAQFKEGAFIGQHGSWNRKPHSGYKVIFVPFAAGKPNGAPVDVLTGFLDKDENALGRPVGVVIDQQGGLLVADDVGNKVWRVSATK